MIEFPTVDDWFQLARRYPDYKRVNTAVLKDYGVMRCSQYIEDTFGSRGKSLRLMEFGHGFNPALLARFQNTHEVWGVDRDQKLSYFGSRLDWDARFAREVAPLTGQVRFVRELLSRQTTNSEIPEDYFDCICSVSVLEEVSLDIVADIVGAAFDKLRPGGVLMGTHDVALQTAEQRMPAYIDIQRSAGFEIDPLPVMPPLAPWRLLLEHGATVILHYQNAQPEAQRRYWGHFGTCFTVARKPA